VTTILANLLGRSVVSAITQHAGFRPIRSADNTADVVAADSDLCAQSRRGNGKNDGHRRHADIPANVSHFALQSRFALNTGRDPGSNDRP
jgi:hypothetical protein